MKNYGKKIFKVWYPDGKGNFIDCGEIERILHENEDGCYIRFAFADHKVLALNPKKKHQEVVIYP